MYLLRRIAQATLVLCALAASSLTLAQTSAPDAADIRHVSGGIGASEREHLQGMKSQYSFWLRTAIKRSGAYLSGAHVRITDTRSKKLVLEVTMDGPWLLADLPAGRYDVEASYQGTGPALQKQKATTEIRKGATRQMILYFEGTAGEMSIEERSQENSMPKNGQ